MSESLLCDSEKCKRVVIKIGSALLRDTTTKKLRESWLASLAEDIIALRSQGQQVIIVSSGAIAMGQFPLGFNSRPTELENAQAAAAVGQVRLAHAYQSLFEVYNVPVAQILLTIGDLEGRRRYLNARNTMEVLLDRGVIPIVNENDTVATDELRFGDNDRLAARVAQLCGANALIILSDIDGLYTADPHTDPQATLIKTVKQITPDVEAMAGPPARETPGSGGMTTKIEAAKIATAAGCSMIIASGAEDHAIANYRQGQRGTVFSATSAPLTDRKQWIRGLMAPEGYLHIDDSAMAALTNGASLLPAGMTGSDGIFNRGELVAIIDSHGKAIGQGLVSYTSVEASAMAGKFSCEAQQVLGYAARTAIIHRDDLILF